MVWDYPTLVAAVEEAGFEDIGVYITRRHNTAAQHVATRPILELYERSVRRPIAWVSQRWWYKEEVNLEAERGGVGIVMGPPKEVRPLRTNVPWSWMKSTDCMSGYLVSIWYSKYRYLSTYNTALIIGINVTAPTPSIYLFWPWLYIPILPEYLNKYINANKYITITIT